MEFCPAGGRQYNAAMPVNRKKIAALRRAKLLTMEEAAKRAGLGTRQRWYSVEAGQRENVLADTLYAVARALGVSMEELMIQHTAGNPKAKGKA
jgi:transcriptional regulator with XRE-family HTH domain